MILKLNFLQSKFNIGKVYVYSTSPSLKVFRPDVKVIIYIFSDNPLNTTKRLDFQDWKKAFELYVNRNLDRDNIECKSTVLSKVAEIKSGMNQSRIYAISNLDNIRVTKYWLLGFIEGEGIFM
uniref:Homing endonuclease LAGLIDADG domain-containing protein n=1 Tax=Juglanconis juglandina TaxID=1940567 RepID=A0A291LJF6_9PEZI|nr:hypothetical protein [Juglanconis juglandina]